MTETRRYRVYLLRLWLVVSDDGAATWRASLEEARSGERHGFADLTRLFAFLEQQTAAESRRIAPPSEEEP
jgi:hypothetical protein